VSARDEAVQVALRDSRPGGDGWRRANCPLCALRVGKPDRRRSLGFAPSSGFWHCFRCGARGRLDGSPVGAAKPSERADLEMPSSFLPLSDEPARSALAARDSREYLTARGIGPAMWRAARLGVALSGRHYGRVIAPVMDDEGRKWLGWVGRAWVERAEQPYLYPRGMPRGELVYNHETLLVETDEPAMVSEGVFDTFPVWPDGVALLGKASEPQVEALLAARRPLAVVLDGDAWKEGWVLAMRLRMMGRRAGAVRLPPLTDPDEVDAGWLRTEMRRCITESV
jgi:DNA primase